VCVCARACVCVVPQTGEETERWRKLWLLATKQLRVDMSALFELAVAYLLSDTSELW
jgi:hypothetical protein